jgi:hypothetical protein
MNGEWRLAVSLVPSAVVPPPVAERPPTRAGNRAQWLIVGCYILAAVAVTWRLWADPAARAQAGDTADVDLFAWFMRYDAVAIAHGHLPALFTTAMNAPRGINLMWNTSFLLPGVLLAPVTLLAGPQVSLTIMLTLGLAGSAASLFWVLRRWGASAGAAALGGAVYGFSPALINSGIGHYHLQFAVLPPLIIDALLRILAGRGSAVRSGAWLGLLAAAQLLTGEELLADTALAALVLVAVLAASHPRAVRDRARDVASGIGVSVAVVLLICGHALWVQFAGPLTQHNHPAGPEPFTNRLAFFVDPAGNLLLHTPAAAAAAYSRGLSEYLGYLGWPLLAVLVAATIRYWRDPKVRTMAVLWLALELFSLGGGTLSHGGFQLPGYLLPFHWLQGSPVLSQALPDRLSILADGAAGAVLAFSLDPARRAALASPAWRRPIPAAVAVLAVLPLVPLRYPAAPVAATPAGWQAAFARLRLAPGARVLVVPVALQRDTEVMRWQADTGDPASMIGGYFIGPDKSGQQEIYIPGPATTAAQYLDDLWKGPPPADRLSPGLIRADIAYWRPAAVVAVTSRGSRLGRYLAGLFGPPAFAVGSVLAWRLPGVATTAPRNEDAP